MGSHITIRVDGNHEIGYGHLIRSNALVEELLSRGHDATVATTTPQPVRSVFPDAVEITELPSRADPGPFVNWLDDVGPDAVFIDSYPADTEYQRLVRERIPISVLQDDNRHAICADLFINGNLYAADLHYEFDAPEPTALLGPDYVLLRREIRTRARTEPPWRVQPDRALVTMGGSDIANLTPTAIQAFDGLSLHVDAIVGPGFSSSQERSIRTAAETISADVTVTRDPDDLAERMFQADFAVSTSSTTTYELLALGTPIISVPVADNQERMAASLRERDAALVLDRDVETTGFRRAIRTYVSNPAHRRTRRELGRRLVDGQGTERIAAEVIAMANGNA